MNSEWVNLIVASIDYSFILGGIFDIAGAILFVYIVIRGSKWLTNSLRGFSYA